METLKESPPHRCQALFENLRVVYVAELLALLAAHLLHVLPGEEVLRPPDRFRVRVAVLRPPAPVAEPDQFGEIGPGLGRL